LKNRQINLNNKFFPQFFLSSYKFLKVFILWPGYRFSAISLYLVISSSDRYESIWPRLCSCQSCNQTALEHPDPQTLLPRDNEALSSPASVDDWVIHPWTELLISIEFFSVPQSWALVFFLYLKNIILKESKKPLTMYFCLFYEIDLWDLWKGLLDFNWVNETASLIPSEDILLLVKYYLKNFVVFQWVEEEAKKYKEGNKWTVEYINILGIEWY